MRVKRLGRWILYVAVWKVVSWEKQIIEIRFVGPHGSVDYSRFK
jgi:hypothetical protein